MSHEQPNSPPVASCSWLAAQNSKLKAMAGLPPYLVLLRVGFALPAALLSRRCALTAPFHPYPGVAVEAVYFLWHFPSSGLESALPDVIRHTALRSSDFPPSRPKTRERPSGPAAYATIIGHGEVGSWLPPLGFRRLCRPGGESALKSRSPGRPRPRSLTERTLRLTLRAGCVRAYAISN
jgi:hypothetical protein